MTKKNSGSLQKKWVVIPAILVVFLLLFVFVKNSSPPKLSESTAYSVYQNPQYGFSIGYPQAWEIRQDAQVFENGDAVTFQKTGPTQKAQTEFYDGGKVTIAKPFKVGMNLTTWVKDRHGNQSQFSKQTISDVVFEKVTDCSFGCSNFYYAMIGNDVFAMATFAEGADKMVYENAIAYMLNSLQLNSTTNKATVNETITKEAAVAKVKALPEVIEYLKEVPGGLVAVNGDEDNAYMVQVYEFKNGHTATFNWYTTDKTTGVVEKQF